MVRTAKDGRPTAGEWRVSETDEALIVAGRHGVHLARVVMQGHGFDGPRNAALMAAAKRMHAALTHLQDVIRPEGSRVLGSSGADITGGVREVLTAALAGLEG